MNKFSDGIRIIDRHDQHDDGGDQGELFEEQSGLILGITRNFAGGKASELEQQKNAREPDDTDYRDGVAIETVGERLC